jgi:hypothetical protein
MAGRHICKGRRPWNKGLRIGQKKPLEPKHVWSIRVRLEIARSTRDLAIFNLAIDSKLRACDLVKLRLDDICLGTRVRRRALSSKRRRDDQDRQTDRNDEDKTQSHGLSDSLSITDQ